MIDVKETAAEGLVLIKPRVFTDSRGYFVETFNARALEAQGLPSKFVQDNQSFSKRGVLRGLHFQRAPYAQTKLVRAIQGRILDVVVDLRPDSATFKQVFSFEHAFLVLSETALVAYKCDDFYAPESDGGIVYNDPDLAIEWPLPSSELIVSEKDQKLPTLKEHLSRG